jgi:hypothetical protein
MAGAARYIHLRPDSRHLKKGDRQTYLQVAKGDLAGVVPPVRISLLHQVGRRQAATKTLYPYLLTGYGQGYWKTMATQSERHSSKVKIR